MREQPGHYLLYLEPGRWSLWDANLSSPGCLLAGEWQADASAQVGGSLASYRQEATGPMEVAIGLHANLCLAATFPLPAARSLRRRAALAYRLEESLPLAAEDLAVDFLQSPRGVLAVAAERAWLDPLVTSLATAGVEVRSVAPLALLAAAEILSEGKFPSSASLLLEDASGADCLLIESGKPTNWRRISGSPGGADQELDYQALSMGLSVAIERRGSRELPLLLRRAEGRTGPADADDGGAVVDYARCRVNRILAGSAAANCELLQDELEQIASASPPLRWERRALHAAAFALLVLVAALQVRTAWRDGRQAELFDAAQAGVFRDTFPEQRVPLGVRNRLASELRRLQGVRGESAGAPDPQHVMDVLKVVLASLPEGMRYRVLEVRLEEGRLLVTGHVRSHGDADRIAAALRQHGLSVGPPSTQQLPQQGVDFRLSAEFPSAGAEA